VHLRHPTCLTRAIDTFGKSRSLFPHGHSKDTTNPAAELPKAVLFSGLAGAVAHFRLAPGPTTARMETFFEKVLNSSNAHIIVFMRSQFIGCSQALLQPVRFKARRRAMLVKA
jgi:hypothetical protein